MPDTIRAHSKPLGALVLISIRVGYNIFLQGFPINLCCWFVMSLLRHDIPTPSHHTGKPNIKTLGNLSKGKLLSCFDQKDFLTEI